MKRFGRLRFANKIGLLCGCLLLAGNLSAQSCKEDIRWHGFFSQGITYTDENNFFGDSQNTSLDFRNIGFGGAWQAHDRLLFSAQAIYRDAGQTSPEGVKIDYALANYSLINRFDFGFGIRAGRVKNPYGFYSETRDVAATRPSVILPVSIYAPAFRDVFHSSDSLILTGYQQLGDWLVNFDVLRGAVPFDKKSERLLIPGMQPASIEDDRLWAARSIWEYDGGRMRLGATVINFEADIDTQPAIIFPGDLEVNGYLLSFEYNWESFQFVSEYQRNRFTYKGVIAPGLDTSRESEAYYLQLSHHVNENLKVFGRYDLYYADRHDKSGSNQLLFGRPKSDGFSESYAVGAQYHFASDWLLAGEFHLFNGTGALPVIENSVAADVKENWKLFTLQLSYKF